MKATVIKSEKWSDDQVDGYRLEILLESGQKGYVDAGDNKKPYKPNDKIKVRIIEEGYPYNFYKPI